MATTKVSNNKGVVVVVDTVAATFQHTEPHLHPPTIIIFIITGEEEEEEDKDIKEIATVLLQLLLLPLDLLDTKAREDMAWEEEEEEGEVVPKARVDMAPLELPKARVLVAVMVVEEEA